MTAVDEARDALLAAWHAHASTIEITELLDAFEAAVRAEQEGEARCGYTTFGKQCVYPVGHAHGHSMVPDAVALATPPAPEPEP